MTKTLDEQIHERKQQAEKRNISRKALRVADERGAKTVYADRFGYPGTVTRVFNDAANALEVRYEHNDYPGSAKSLTVSFNGKKVFQAEVFGWGDGLTSRVDAYIPGTWEEKLDAVFQTVPAQNETKVTPAQRAVDEKEKRARWGL